MIFAAMTAIFITAILTLERLVYSLKGAGLGSKSAGRETNADHSIGCARGDDDRGDAGSFSNVRGILDDRDCAAGELSKKGRLSDTFGADSDFPALLGGMSGDGNDACPCAPFQFFNASQMIRGIMLGDATNLTFAITTVANLVYAGIAFWIATRTFENENVLFRS